MGYRYRIHDKNLPGKPDIVFAGRKKVIFVHGCFWHMHECRFGKVTPKTNAEFWAKKRSANVARDQEAISTLKAMGWDVFIAWECDIKEKEELQKKIKIFLE